MSTRVNPTVQALEKLIWAIYDSDKDVLTYGQVVQILDVLEQAVADE